MLVSRATIAKIEQFKKRMGWNFPWFSSFGSDFNYDFQASLDEAVTPAVYNVSGSLKTNVQLKSSFAHRESIALI